MNFARQWDFFNSSEAISMRNYKSYYGMLFTHVELIGGATPDWSFEQLGAEKQQQWQCDRSSNLLV